MEAADNGAAVDQLMLPDDAPLTAEHRSDLLGGVTILRGDAPAITAIPYYAWSHRGPGAMAVWLLRDMS